MSGPAMPAAGPAGGSGNLADPVERLIAGLIDLGILIGGWIAVLIVSFLLGYIPVLGFILRMLLPLLYLVAMIGYFVYLTTYDNPYTGRGQTIGKKMRNLKVVKEDGSDIVLMDAILRFVVGYAVSGMVIGLGFIWIFIDANKQGWHDKIAKTKVIKV